MILFVSDYECENGGTPRAASPYKIRDTGNKWIKNNFNKKDRFIRMAKSFHDHIIRSEREFLEICGYIDNNPINWVNHIYNQNFWR